MEAYLDNSATTKCAREVVETVVKAMQDDYGNPSSKHMKGVDAEQYIKQAAATIARSLKCQEKELVFKTCRSCKPLFAEKILFHFRNHYFT